MEKLLKVAEQVNGIFGNLICQQVKDRSKGRLWQEKILVQTEDFSSFLHYFSLQALERLEKEWELLNFSMALSFQL